MVLTSIRLGFLLATLVASLHAAAAPRYWTLTDVGLSGFGFPIVAVSGYFSYDDATQTIANWNVQVDSAFGVVTGFAYVPGNSTTSITQTPGGGAPTLLFSATIGVPGQVSALRELRIAPRAALDGSWLRVQAGVVKVDAKI